MARLLQSGGLSCKVLDKVPFTRAMLEKLVWISAFMAVGAKHKVTVGEVEKAHTEEVSLLIMELAAAGQVGHRVSKTEIHAIDEVLLSGMEAMP